MRDFHNLIGRAGRAGIHTEGTILFADPDLYDKRGQWSGGGKWRWEQTTRLFNPQNSEPCGSSLFSLFAPIRSDDGRRDLLTIGPSDFVRQYVAGPGAVERSIAQVPELGLKGVSEGNVRHQYRMKLDQVAAIESYLLAHWDDNPDELQVEAVQRLATSTLAYWLANDEQRVELLLVFQLLATHIETTVQTPERRRAMGRSLCGVRRGVEIESWTHENIEALEEADGDEAVLAKLWPLLTQQTRHATLQRCDPPGAMFNLAVEWIGGVAFHALLASVKRAKARIVAGERRRRFTIGHVVDVCQSAFAFDATLTLATVIEFVEQTNRPERQTIVDTLARLQKRLRYGLESVTEIVCYEFGFADREVSKALALVLPVEIETQGSLMAAIENNVDEVRATVSRFPSFFEAVLNRAR